LLYPDRYELKTIMEAETYLVSLTMDLDAVAAPAEPAPAIINHKILVKPATELTA
jgi:hypothetical protein